jgi:4-amino-4-deoxychorismate lyase
VIVNGEYINQVSLSDRSVQFGDGCFTTLLVTKGIAEFWSAHRQRLMQGCERLSINFSAWELLEKSVYELSQKHNKAVLKVIISRGIGGRGYGTDESAVPSFFISQHAFPNHYLEWQAQGIALSLSPILLAKQPLLAGIKHLNRLEQVLIKQQLQHTTFDDVIVCDTDKHLVESSAANLFWCIGNTWFTPDLSQSGVDGVMRNQVLRYFKQQGIAVKLVKIGSEALLKAEQLFLCNSVMKVIPARNFQANPQAQVVHYEPKQLQELHHWLSLESSKK